MASSALEWLSLVAMIWLQAISGTNTNFPAYSSQLKQLLSISQVQLNNLAFASDAGKLFGWFSGMASLHLPLWLVLIIGSTLGFIGYGLQYLFITNQIPSFSYWHVFFLTLLAGNSICWINTVSYVVTIRNFPSHHRIAVGLTTSYQGLTAKIYTDIVNVVSPHKQARSFLFLNSILPLIVCLIAAPLTTQVQVTRTKGISIRFVVMFVITIATGFYAMITSFQFLSTILSPLNNLLGILVSLFLPLLVPISQKINELVRLWQRKRERFRVYHFTVDENTSPRTQSNHEVKQEEESRQLVVEEIGVREEIGVKQMVRRIDFWLYFFVYFFGATLGLVFLNNLGQIAESRSCSNISSLVSLSSSFGFFGRLMPSLTDYFFRGKIRISRPACIVASMAPISGSFFLLLNNTDIALYTSTAIIGVCTGAITSIAVSTTTELFGTKNFSVNHNVVVLNIPIGSFLFGYMAALFYRKEEDGDGKCIGMECYRLTFIIWGSLCFFGTFLAFILHARTRDFYYSHSTR